MSHMRPSVMATWGMCSSGNEPEVISSRTIGLCSSTQVHVS